jgi:NADPH:quinone reductase-like Zn-dependent oxidoreductase
MRSVIINRYGDPDVLEVVEQETPEPAADEVRIKVAGAALNPADAALRAGALAPVLGERFPFGIGWDVAGTIDAVGAGVAELRIGDPVVGVLNGFGVASGTHASHVVLPVASVAPAPKGVDLVSAATFGLNALTADQALDLLALADGSTLVVTGAAGGVGDYAVALGAQRGLRVIGVARASDEAEVRAAGAADFVAATDDLSGAIRALVPGGADGVIDAAQLGANALGAVRDGGAFVAVTDPSEPDSERGVRVATVHVQPDGASLADLSQGVDAGWLRLRVAATYPLAEVAAAHRAVEQGGIRGRVVLVP